MKIDTHSGVSHLCRRPDPVTAFPNKPITDNWTRYLRVRASMVAAVTPSAAGVTATSMPVARPLSCDGWPLTVILVAGVTLYSLAECVAKRLIVIEVR